MALGLLFRRTGDTLSRHMNEQNRAKCPGQRASWCSAFISSIIIWQNSEADIFTSFFFTVNVGRLNITVGSYLHLAAHDFVCFPIVHVKLHCAMLTQHREWCWPTSNDSKDKFSVGLAVIDGLWFTGCLLLRSGAGWVESFDLAFFFFLFLFLCSGATGLSPWWDSVHLGRKNNRILWFLFEVLLFCLQPPCGLPATPGSL